MKKKKKKKEKNVQNESWKISFFYITPFFLTNIQNKVGLHSAQPIILILQETLFQVQVLKPCKSIKIQVRKVLFIKPRQLASIKTCKAVPAHGSTAAQQIGICRDL